jgi:hypothetical protein
MLGSAVEGYITVFGEDHADTLDAKLYAICRSTYVLKSAASLR